MGNDRQLRPVASLTVSDFETCPVWRFTDDDEPDETYVSPVERIPVADFDGAVVATQVHLADGNANWALLGNIDVRNPASTLHFLSISVMAHGDWFHLARYHDRDAALRGPEALSSFLGLPIERVFPIRYDISALCITRSESLRGTITREPETRLSREQLIALAVG